MDEKSYVRINGIGKEHFEQSDQVLKKIHDKIDFCMCMFLLTRKLHMYKAAKKFRQKGIDYAIAGLKLCEANIDLLMTASKYNSFKK